MCCHVCLSGCSLLNWGSILLQDFLVYCQNTISSPSPLPSLCMTLELLLFLVAFLRAWTLLCSYFKSSSLWVRQRWRQSCCHFLKSVLCVQDTLVNFVGSMLYGEQQSCPACRIAHANSTTSC